MIRGRRGGKGRAAGRCHGGAVVDIDTPGKGRGSGELATWQRPPCSVVARSPSVRVQQHHDLTARFRAVAEHRGPSCDRPGESVLPSQRSCTGEGPRVLVECPLSSNRAMTQSGIDLGGIEEGRGGGGTRDDQVVQR